MKLCQDAETLLHEGADFLGFEEGGVAIEEERVFGGLDGEAWLLVEVVEHVAGE